MFHYRAMNNIHIFYIYIVYYSLEISFSNSSLFPHFSLQDVLLSSDINLLVDCDKLSNICKTLAFVHRQNGKQKTMIQLNTLKQNTGTQDAKVTTIAMQMSKPSHHLGVYSDFIDGDTSNFTQLKLVEDCKISNFAPPQATLDNKDNAAYLDARRQITSKCKKLSSEEFALKKEEAKNKKFPQKRSLLCLLRKYVNAPTTLYMTLMI